MDFLLIFKTVIISIIKGATNYLPIAASEQGYIVYRLLAYPSGDKATMIYALIGLGSSMAVLVLLSHRIKESFNFMGQGQKKGMRLWTNIFLGAIPYIILYFVFMKIGKINLLGSKVIAFGAIASGILLFIGNGKYRRNRIRKKAIASFWKINGLQAFKIGLYQCLSFIPGLSRVGAVIVGGWFSNLATGASVDLALFITVPGVILVSIRDLFYVASAITFGASEIVSMILAVAVSFLTALVTLDSFLSFAKKASLKLFAFFNILLGSATLVFMLLGKIN